MGGHAAWRKRLERGELAKGSGGAICRHKSHLGKKPKDVYKSRPRKKIKNDEQKEELQSDSSREHKEIHLERNMKFYLWLIIITVGIIITITFCHRTLSMNRYYFQFKPI